MSVQLWVELSIEWLELSTETGPLPEPNALPWSTVTFPPMVVELAVLVTAPLPNPVVSCSPVTAWLPLPTTLPLPWTFVLPISLPLPVVIGEWSTLPPTATEPSPLAVVLCSSIVWSKAPPCVSICWLIELSVT